MKILLIEPFFTGSHQRWAEGLQQHSHHEVELLTLPGRHWKWRMHGGAITLARQFLEMGFTPDLVLATDMLDVTVFKSLAADRLGSTPIYLYFHENQLTYPWSPNDEDVQLERDHHYAFINYASALAADRVLFNSHYHHECFLSALPGFLQNFPKPNEKESVPAIAEKSTVLPLAMDLRKFDEAKKEKPEKPNRAVILWNHRWEYDKNPEQFFRILGMLQQRGVEFKLIVLGEKTNSYPKVFDEAQQQFSEELLHFGYVADFNEYARLLCLADLLFVTSRQDFFGGSVVEALYCNVKPILPKRLAYPEHIPEEYHPNFFYDPMNDRELANYLQRVIFSVNIMRKQKTEQFVEQYDWRGMVGEYDEILISNL